MSRVLSSVPEGNANRGNIRRRKFLVSEVDRPALSDNTSPASQGIAWALGARNPGAILRSGVFHVANRFANANAAACSQAATLLSPTPSADPVPPHHPGPEFWPRRQYPNCVRASR